MDEGRDAKQYRTYVHEVALLCNLVKQFQFCIVIKSMYYKQCVHVHIHNTQGHMNSWPFFVGD